jgi:hypothetical protein
MIKPGETLMNPVTGEAMTFLTTSSETGGEYVTFILRRARPSRCWRASSVSRLTAMSGR